MSKSSDSSSGGIFLDLLGLLFIGLKLTHYIDWSWWYVLMPLYLHVAFFLSVLLFVGVAAIFAKIISWL